jgi:hypothetical protein
VQRKASVCVWRTCGIARRQPSKGASAACYGEEGERRAAGAAHYQRWCSAGLRDRSAASLERGAGRVRWRGRRAAGAAQGKRLCPADLRRRETGMAAAARAVWGAIGGHSLTFRIVPQSRLRSTQLQRLQDRSAAALELRRGRVRWKKEEGGRRAQRITSAGCSAGLRDRSAEALETGVGRVRWRGRRKAGGGCSARQACVFGGPAGSHCGSSRIEARPRAVARKEEVGRRFVVMVCRRRFGGDCCGYGAAAAGRGKMV